MKDYSFYLQGSKKKGVLLVHGLTGSPLEMKFIGKQLNRMGFTVYAPVLAGHCQDKKTLVKTTYEDWIYSLKTALYKFQNEVAEIYMAGICVGGALALLAAHQENRLVKGVAIYSPTLNYDGWNVPFYYPWAPYGIPIGIRIPFLNRISFSESYPYGIKSDRVRKAVIGNANGIEGTLPHFPVKALHQNYRLNNAMKKSLPKITIPTLLIHAKDDDVSHPRNSAKIKKLHGGDCRVIILENSYHMIHVDQERQRVAELTAEFFGIGEAENLLNFA
jgi:carboxylesterase